MYHDVTISCFGIDYIYRLMVMLPFRRFTIDKGIFSSCHKGQPIYNPRKCVGGISSLLYIKIKQIQIEGVIVSMKRRPFVYKCILFSCFTPTQT